MMHPGAISFDSLMRQIWEDNRETGNGSRKACAIIRHFDKPIRLVDVAGYFGDELQRCNADAGRQIKFIANRLLDGSTVGGCGFKVPVTSRNASSSDSG